ncbi:uncharacterized protein LOC114758414 [Neltuma alba]|uniref:uncharacterized protein LOC114758414 n=1 Tax=Neltuma alba TaxID=207710 RepID=UPI0010A36FD3|nr:uncharacterized protein LOC114758414 [Prosopis alba]
MTSATTKLKGTRDRLQNQIPPGDKTTMEVDGAYSFRHNIAAYGGVIKSAGMTALEGFMMKIDATDSLVAELWGCLVGLKRAWDANYREIILRTNSVEAIELIYGESNDMHEDWVLISEIKEMINRDWHVEIHHIDRQNNGHADTLAKKALNGAFGLQILGPNALSYILSSV